MHQAIRVLHVQHSLEPGGMENGVVNVARALQPKGFEFHVVCLARSGEFASRLPDPQLVYALDKPEGFSLRTVLRLRALIKKLRPDVIHSHNLGALIYAACATLYGRTRPILHGEHGQPDEGVDAARRRRQRKRLFRAARRVHTVSVALLDHFLSEGFARQKLLALVNGVDTERFQPGDRNNARESLGIGADRQVLVVVGRLIASKNHLLLFEALERIAKSNPRILLLVVGGGGADEEMINAAATASSASAHIRMAGFQKDPLPYYHAADLLVAPSEIEGLSNVILEAMACQVPPLLHDACGSREVIDQGVDGVVGDLSSATKLSELITLLLSDQETLAAMGQHSRQKVLDQFSLDKMAEAYERVYREVAAL